MKLGLSSTTLDKVMMMKRKNFIKLSSVSFAASVAQSSNLFSQESQDLDQYGGWKDKKFNATGYFRTEHDGRRWWFVTPEGHAFLSFGVNHFHSYMWDQSYNRQHWTNVFKANNRKDPMWEEGFRKSALEFTQHFGFNSLGVHTEAPILNNPPKGPILPYVRRYEPIVLSHYKLPKAEDMVDVFSEDYEKMCDAEAQKSVAPFAHDKMIIGYSMSDFPALTDRMTRNKGMTWARVLRNHGPEAPGKKVYVKCMQKRYSSIESFNNVYKTSFETWDKLLEAKNWREISKYPKSQEELSDNHAFQLLCIDKYYSIAKKALRKVDPNHLLLGDKLPTLGKEFKSIFEVTSKYTDVVNYQLYDVWSNQKVLLDHVTPSVKVPFMLGDATISAPNESQPNPQTPHANDQNQRAKWIEELCHNLFSRPEFIGWHMCGVIDTTNKAKGKEKKQHQGLMKVHGEYYREVEAVIRNFTSKMYQIAEGAI